MTFKFTHLKTATAANTANQLTPIAGKADGAVSKLAALAVVPLFGGWDDAAIELFMRRCGRFSDLRLPDAEELAERLVLRDQDGDDRTLCVECSNYRPSSCVARGAWLPRVFQRCDSFLPSMGEAK